MESRCESSSRAEYPQFINAADVAAMDEQLRQGVSPASCHHGVGGGSVLVHIYFCKGDTEFTKQHFCGLAMGAGRGGVDFYSMFRVVGIRVFPKPNRNSAEIEVSNVKYIN